MVLLVKYDLRVAHFSQYFSFWEKKGKKQTKPYYFWDNKLNIYTNNAKINFSTKNLPIKHPEALLYKSGAHQNRIMAHIANNMAVSLNQYEALFIIKIQVTTTTSTISC